MALILGLLTLPVPAPSVKSIHQSSSASHIPAVPKNQFARCFPSAPGLVVRFLSVLTSNALHIAHAVTGPAAALLS